MKIALSFLLGLGIGVAGIILLRSPKEHPAYEDTEEIATGQRELLPAEARQLLKTEQGIYLLRRIISPNEQATADSRRVALAAIRNSHVSTITDSLAYSSWKDADLDVRAEAFEDVEDRLLAITTAISGSLAMEDNTDLLRRKAGVLRSICGLEQEDLEELASEVDARIQAVRKKGDGMEGRESTHR